MPLLASADVEHSTSRRALLPRPRPVPHAPLGLVVGRGRLAEGSGTVEIEIGRGKKARRAYGFDDIAIVPSRRTRDAEDVDIGWKLGPYLLELPLLASAMDGVVSPTIATQMGR